MSDYGPEDVITAAELDGGLSEPVTGGGTDLALISDSPEEYQDELARENEEAGDLARDEYLARKIRAMEAAGASEDDIEAMLVDELSG
jgi:hypothetical protein